MDYSYFPPAQQQQQYPFLGLPPTPAHTASANTSDEFSNSPSVCAPSPLYPSQNISYQSSSRSFSFSQSQSQSLSQSLSQSPYSPYASGSPRSSSNPTYPFVALTARQDDFSHFQNYDYAQAQYAPGSVPQVKPPTPLHKPSITASNGFDMSLLPSSEEMQRGSNSDEDEKDMTPAQSRRKAQNRAAQRAFRERKERHVKDLEAKLAALEKNTLSISEENERLKLQLQKTATENEILKATSANPSRSPILPDAEPLGYKPTDFYSDLLQTHDNKSPSHRIVLSENGERLLAAGATWDYIIKHPLFIKGYVDVGHVSERLKGRAKCDGQGPVFEESAILDAIEKSVASGSDELL